MKRQLASLLLIAQAVLAAEPAPPPAANPLAFADGSVVFGIEDQTRFEYRDNNFDFNSGMRTATDDSWLLNRARIGLQLKPADWLTFDVQGQDSREIGSSRPDIPGRLGAEGDNPFDLRQAYTEIGDAKSFPFSLKVGRQVLLYGDQRLIGPLEWSNLTRTFDAAKLRYTGKNGLGTHWKSTPGKLGPWDYESEFVAQNGTAGGRALQAFASYIEGGYTFQQAWKPRLSLEYSYASGDGNAADRKQGAFQNLFPTNHLHYGFMDAFSWSNIHNVVLHLGAKPNAKITTSLDYHFFWLADTADTWRRANAATAVRPAKASASNYAGSELDLLMAYAVCTHFNVTLGYSHFFAGRYLSDTGAGSDADFVYVMTGIKF
jgi:hypothetical protein